MYKIVRRRLLITDPKIIIIHDVPLQTYIISNKNIHDKQRLIVITLL